jgi:hypothetical protein
MIRFGRTVKLLALGLLASPMLHQLACSTREIQAAASAGVQTTLVALFENFAEDVADGLTGNDG